MAWAALFFALFAIAGGLGYATLNRYAEVPSGLADGVHYRAMTNGEGAAVPAPFRYRVLVPAAARAIARTIEPIPLGTWRRDALALLVVTSALTAITGLFLFALARRTETRPEAVTLAPFVFVSSFGVVNAHLVGLVDASETTAIAIALWLIETGRWRWVPLLMGIAALGKETAPAFVAVLAVTAWTWDRLRDRAVAAAKSLGGIAIGAVIACLVHLSVRTLVGPGPWDEPFSPRLPVLADLTAVVASREWVYTFALLGALAAPRLRGLPPRLLVGSSAMGVCAVALSVVGGIGNNAARPTFDVLAPVLCLAAARSLADLAGHLRRA